MCHTSSTMPSFNNALVLQWHLAVTRDAANFTSFPFAHRYIVYFPCIENEYKVIQNIFHTHYGCFFQAGGLLAPGEVVGNCRWNTGTVEHLSNFFFPGRLHLWVASPGHTVKTWKKLLFHCSTVPIFYPSFEYTTKNASLTLKTLLCWGSRSKYYCSATVPLLFH